MDSQVKRLHFKKKLLILCITIAIIKRNEWINTIFLFWILLCLNMNKSIYMIDLNLIHLVLVYYKLLIVCYVSEYNFLFIWICSEREKGHIIALIMYRVLEIDELTLYATKCVKPTQDLKLHRKVRDPHFLLS